MKNFFGVVAIIFFILLVFTNCVTKLTPAGENVKIIVKEEPPDEANFLGTVESGLFQTHFTQESVINDLRNKTANLGGNLLIIDIINVITNNEYGVEYKGIGRAFFIE